MFWNAADVDAGIGMEVDGLHLAGILAVERQPDRATFRGLETVGVPLGQMGQEALTYSSKAPFNYFFIRTFS